MPELLQYRLADVNIAIDAPCEIRPIVAESYRRFPAAKTAQAHAIVRVVTIEHGEIAIYVGEKHYKTVSAAAGHGLVGLELSNAIITAVAQRSRFLIVHATAVEQDGKALCIAARGHAGKTLLATHFTSRGWRILSDEYAFIEPVSGHIVPFPKLLYVRSSSLPFIPRSFRKSVEFSPWYGLGNWPGLVFSGVDPADSYSESVWSEGARLVKLLLLTGRTNTGPSITHCEPWSIVPDLNALVWQPEDLLDGLSKIATALRGVQVARLAAADPIATVNVVENWARHGERSPVYA